MKFQVLNVNLPNLFSNAIQDTVNAQQGIEKAFNDLKAAETAAETVKVKAAIDATQIRVQKDGVATVTTVAKLAEAGALDIELSAEVDAYKAFKDSLSTALGREVGTKELLSYIWMENVLSTNVNANVVLELDKPKDLQAFSYASE